MSSELASSHASPPTLNEAVTGPAIPVRSSVTAWVQPPSSPAGSSPAAANCSLMYATVFSSPGVAGARPSNPSEARMRRCVARLSLLISPACACCAGTSPAAAAASASGGAPSPQAASAKPARATASMRMWNCLMARSSVMGGGHCAPRRAPGRGAGVARPLLDGHALGQVPRLVHVGAARQRGVVRQHLHRDGVHDRAEHADVARGADDVHALGFAELAVLVCEHVHLAAARAHFLDVGLHLLQQQVVGGDH